jgi:MATE family, multidrug efflux pump
LISIKGTLLTLHHPSNPPPNNLSDHLTRTLKLAGPVIVSRLGVLSIVVIDTAMTGHFSTSEMAYLGIGSAPMFTLLLIGIGLLVGTAILIAQACGAGEPELAGSIWRVSSWHALGLGVIGAIICQFGEPFFLFLGQTRELAKGAGDVLAVYGWQLVPFFVAISASMFLESIHKPHIGAIVIFIANILNVGLNWILIYGLDNSILGISPMGAEGAVIATFIVRCFIAACLISYAFHMKDKAYFGVGRVVGKTREISKKLWGLGVPLGIAHGLESAAFSAIMMIAGLLGTVEASTYQLSNNLVALAFMVAIGTSTAASIRVGNAVGRNDLQGVKVAGWSALLIVIAFSSISCALFLIFPEYLARIFTEDPEVILLATVTIGIAGFYLITDGMQSVMIGALRGRADVWVPTMIQLLSFWAIAVPGAYYASLIHDYGVPGLMYAIMAGVTFSAIFNTIRFHLVAKKPLRRY